MRNYYKVLGIPDSATDSEIKQAYRKMAALYHPDRNPHDPLAVHEMNIINQAYEVLSDPEKRARYDSINNFPGAPLEMQSDPSSDVSSALKTEYFQSSSPKLQQDPFSMSTDQTPRYQENITNVIWTMLNPNRDSITPCMKNVLWIDVFISIIYLTYYFIVRSGLPHMPPGSRNYYYMYRQTTTSWMTHLQLAAYLELVASIAAIFWMKRTKRSHFLKSYLLIKCYLFISVAAAFFGMTTTEKSIFVPAIVLLWEAFLIASLFISRLQQVLWRSP